MTEAPAKALDLGEIARRLANVVRYGSVREVDLDRALARVAYADSGEGPVLTGWLPFWTRMAGEDRDWRPPSVGEKAVLLSPFGELSAGFVLAGFATRDFPAPESSGANRVALYRDGARIEYDAEAHALKAVLPEGGSASITAPGGLSVDGDTEVDGDLAVDGDLSVTGDLDVDGKVDAGGDVSDASGSMQEMRNTYNAHVHGVAPGPVTPPIAPTSRMT